MYNLGQELNCACPSCIVCEESKSKIRALLLGVYQTLLPYFFGPRLEFVFEQSLKLSRYIPKRYDAFQVLKWFLLLLAHICMRVKY